MTSLRSALRATFFLPLLLLVACDSSGDDDGDGSRLGNGSASVTGALTSQFSGSAVFTVSEDQQGSGFILLIADTDDPTEDEPTEFVTVLRRGERPAVGTYDLEVDSTNVPVMIAGYYKASGSSETIVAGVTGTLTITESTSSRVKGSYEFDGGVDTDEDGELDEEAAFSGSFEAVYVEPDAGE